MAFIHAVAIAAFLVLGTAMKSGACPLMGNPTCTTVSDQEVLNSLQASNVSNVMVDLAVSATLEDLLNEAGDFRWFQGTIPLYRRLPRNCNSSSVCGCNLTYSSHYDRLYGTPLCSWSYTCNYDRNRIPQYLWQADCSRSSPPAELTASATSDCECPRYECEPIHYKIPVLTLGSNPRNCNPFSLQDPDWSWRLDEVPVACSCNKKCSCEE